MSNAEEKSWLDTLSDILTQPLPGTEQKVEAPQPPVIHSDDEDEDSLLDAITDILSQPLPGTEVPVEPEVAQEPVPAPADEIVREDQGEVAVREAAGEADEDEDPAITAGTAGADWMQREYDRFNEHQERERQRFAERQRYEMERFFEYQKRQLKQFSRSQQREQKVFRKHQKRRSKAWRGDMRAHWPHREMPPGMAPPPPPPPPPWWRKERKHKKRKGRGRGRGRSDD